MSRRIGLILWGVVIGLTIGAVQMGSRAPDAFTAVFFSTLFAALGVTYFNCSCREWAEFSEQVMHERTRLMDESAKSRAFYLRRIGRACGYGTPSA